MWSLPASVNTLEKAKFISSPFCSYSSRCHRKNELNNYLLSVEVEGKVSVLMGLASASAKYRHKEESSIKREVFSLSLSVYARKGYLVPEAHTKISDQGVDFDVEAMEIGMEDILIVTSEHEREVKKTENTVEFKVRILFFSISAKLEHIHKSSEVKGFVRIDHYSSQTRNWKNWDYDADSFHQAMAKVKDLENNMYNIPNIVNRDPYTKLYALRIVVTPKVGDAFKVAVCLELKKMLNELQVMSVASSKYRIDFEVDKIKQSLKDLKDNAMEKYFLKRLEEIR
ncbi:hypothetical protein ABFA07_009252 [Porites harrisoni]